MMIWFNSALFDMNLVFYNSNKRMNTHLNQINQVILSQKRHSNKSSVLEIKPKS